MPPTPMCFGAAVNGPLEMGCFRDASEAVLTGRVKLRLETGIVRHPDHYDGKEIWDMVVAFLGQEQGYRP